MNRRWIVVGAALLTVAVCLILAKSTLVRGFAFGFHIERTQATDEGRSFPLEWRLRELHGNAVRTLRTLELRDSVMRALRASPTTDTASFHAVVAGPETSAVRDTHVVRVLHDNWRSLGIERPRHAVTTVVRLDTSLVFESEGYEQTGWDVVFSPPTERGQPCLTFVRVVQPRHEWSDTLPGIDAALQHAPGLCAYYAAFGEPGAPIAQWLSARDFDLARNPSWGTPLDLSREKRAEAWLSYMLLQRLWPIRLPGPQHTEVPYSRVVPISLLRCADDDRTACERLVLDTSLRMPRWGSLAGWHSFQPFTEDWSSIVIDEFMSAVLRTLGPERFGRFWASTSAPAPAFESAVGRPLGDWTREWVRHAIGRGNRGTDVSALTWLIALVIVAAGFAIASAVAEDRTAG